MSGYASTGRRKNDQMPTPMSATVRMQDEQRLIERRADDAMRERRRRVALVLARDVAPLGRGLVAELGWRQRGHWLPAN